jgi:hypothetical protein
MVSVKLVNQILRIPVMLRRFPASPYITITCPLYEMIELPVALLSVEGPVNFALVRVVNDHRGWFRWQLARGRRFIVVE